MDKNKQQGQAPAPEQQDTKMKSCATQKTFAFKRRWFEKDESFTDRIDQKVNDWLVKTSLAGRPALLGKVCGNHKSGHLVYVFLYTRKIEIKK